MRSQLGLCRVPIPRWQLPDFTQKWILYDFISFGQMPFFRDFLKVMLKTLCWEKKWRSKNHIPNSIGNSQKLPFWKHRFFSEDSTVKQAGELIKTPPKSSGFFSALMTGAKVSWSDSPSPQSSLSLRSDSSTCRMNLSYIIVRVCVCVCMFK